MPESPWQFSTVEILGLHRSTIEIDFDNLRYHCKFIQESLKGEEERFKKFATKATKNLTEKQKEAFYEWHQEETWQIYDVFPSLQWMSSFMLAYGLFEKSLNDVSQSIGRSLSSELTLRDISGQGIERAKIYLRKVCNIDGPFSSQDWQRIIELSKIRNAIAHSSGELDLNKSAHSEVLEIAKKDSTLKISRQDQILKSATLNLSAEFTDNAIVAFQKFLYAICDARKD